MSRFNKKLAVAERIKSKPKQWTHTVEETVEVKAVRCGRTDRFWIESVTGKKPIVHWQAFAFRRLSQRQKRKRARQKAIS